MKFNPGDVVSHPVHGIGVVAKRYISASGVNYLYYVIFADVISNNGLVKVLGSDLTLVEAYLDTGGD